MKLTESELHELFIDTELGKLEADGVDNWGYYSDSFVDYRENNGLDSDYELNNEEKLQALNNSGVDNWGYHDDSLSGFSEWKDYVREQNDKGKDFIDFWEYQEAEEDREEREYQKRKAAEEKARLEAEEQARLDKMRQIAVDSPRLFSLVNMFSEATGDALFAQTQQLDTIIVNLSRKSAMGDYMQAGKKKAVAEKVPAREFMAIFRDETFRLIIENEFSSVIIPALIDVGIPKERIISVMNGLTFIDEMSSHIRYLIESISEVSGVSVPNSYLKVSWDYSSFNDNKLGVNPTKYAMLATKALRITSKIEKESKRVTYSVKNLKLEELTFDVIKETLVNQLVG